MRDGLCFLPFGGTISSRTHSSSGAALPNCFFTHAHTPLFCIVIYRFYHTVLMLMRIHRLYSETHTRTGTGCAAKDAAAAVGACCLLMLGMCCTLR